MGNVNISAARMSGSSPNGGGGRTESQTTATRNNSSSWSTQWQNKGENRHSWDERAIGELMFQGSVAPRARGLDAGIYECPICFLYYGAINASTCCSQPICTDCYLKVRPPRSDVVDCPFCGKEAGATVAAAQKSSRIREQISKPMKQTANKDDETTFDDCGSTPASPKTPIQPTIVTSVHERENLEAAMRKQLEVAKKRGDTAPPVPVSAPGGTRIYAPIGGRRRYRTRLAGDGSLPLRDLRALLHSLPTDLHQVEELMILEAMQASIQDEERRQRQLAEEAQHAAEQAGASSTTVENMHGDAENNQDRQTSTDEDPRIRTDSDPRDDYQPAEEEEEMNIFPPPTSFIGT